MTFSKKLRELRKNKGLNQDELAVLINEQTGKTFTRTTVSNYETAHSKPTLDITTAIANIFGVSIDYLLNSGPSNTQSLHVNDNNNDTYPKYEQLGASEVYESAVNYGYQQDEMIIKIRERIESLTDVMEKCEDELSRESLKEALDMLTDLAAKYHDQTHKLVDSYQRCNRLTDLIQSPFKL